MNVKDTRSKAEKAEFESLWNEENHITPDQKRGIRIAIGMAVLAIGGSLGIIYLDQHK